MKNFRSLPPVAKLSVAFKKQERRESLVRNIRKEFKQLKRDFPGLDLPVHKPKIRFQKKPSYKSDVRFSRQGRSIEVLLSWQYAKYFYPGIWSHLTAHYYWYAKCGADVGPITVNISDGHSPSAAQFAQSSFLPDVTLLPDLHFFTHRGYLKADQTALGSSLNWSQRSDDIIWRGAPNGNGFVHLADEIKDHPSLNQRVRFAQFVKGSAVDFGFVRKPQASEYDCAIESAGLMREPMAEYSWVTRKYAIDIDGFSNAWSNFFIRLKLGCCVFKIESDFGFRQWYYDKLQPFEHFVPVRADFSDFFEKVEWARENPDQVEQIARNGQAVVDSMTFETETAEAVRRITKIAGKSC